MKSPSCIDFFCNTVGTPLRYGLIRRPSPCKTVEVEPVLGYNEAEQMHSHGPHPQNSGSEEPLVFGSFCPEDVPGTGDCKQLSGRNLSSCGAAGISSPGAPESARRKWSDVVREM